jgi:hypothetical protein
MENMVKIKNGHAIVHVPDHLASLANAFLFNRPLATKIKIDAIPTKSMSTDGEVFECFVRDFLNRQADRSFILDNSTDHDLVELCDDERITRVEVKSFTKGSTFSVTERELNGAMNGRVFRWVLVEIGEKGLRLWEVPGMLIPHLISNEISFTRWHNASARIKSLKFIEPDVEFIQ